MEKEQTESLRRKTWKREVATAMLVVLGVAVFNGMDDMVSLIVWPIMTFAAAAFGLDSVAKQFGGK